jgi:histone H3/H4
MFLQDDGSYNEEQIQKAKDVNYGSLRLKIGQEVHKAGVPLNSFLSTGSTYEAFICARGIVGGARKKKPPPYISPEVAERRMKKERNFRELVARLQELDKTVCPAAAFDRLILEATRDIEEYLGKEHKYFKWQKEAKLALQEAAEHFLTDLFTDTNTIARCAKRTTILIRDWDAAVEIGRHQVLVPRDEEPLHVQLAKLKARATAQVDAEGAESVDEDVVEDEDDGSNTPENDDAECDEEDEDEIEEDNMDDDGNYK